METAVPLFASYKKYGEFSTYSFPVCRRLRNGLTTAPGDDVDGEGGGCRRYGTWPDCVSVVKPFNRYLLTMDRMAALTSFLTGNRATLSSAIVFFERYFTRRAWDNWADYLSRLDADFHWIDGTGHRAQLISFNQLNSFGIKLFSASFSEQNKMRLQIESFSVIKDSPIGL